MRKLCSRGFPRFTKAKGSQKPLSLLIIPESATIVLTEGLPDHVGVVVKPIWSTTLSIPLLKKLM